MPHLHIEYSAGLADHISLDTLCQELSAAMQQCGIFPLAGIRVRAFCADAVSIADGHADNQFAHLTLRIGAGRSQDDKQAAGELIFKHARQALSTVLDTSHFALSLEIVEIDASLSWKANPMHARISAAQPSS